MDARARLDRLFAVLAVAALVAACGADATPTAVPDAQASGPTATPTPSPTQAPTAAARSPVPSPEYDGASAVGLHIEMPECVTDEAGTIDYVNGVRQMRGFTRHCRYDDADPRFSGWSDIVVSSDCYLADHSRCIRWGTERIPGPDGDWVGLFWGGQIAEGVRLNLEVLEGTGAYVGWTYVSYIDLAALGGEEWVVDGFIYHGPPPPIPPLPSSSSQ